MSTQITTGKARFSYCNLFTPRAVQEGATPKYCPANTKELKHLDGWESKMSFTSIGTSPESIRLALGAADVSGSKITPRRSLQQTDFSDLWWVGDRADGGMVAICLKNALSTGGFTLQTTKNGKGKVSVELTGHVSIQEQDTMPMEFYSAAPPAIASVPAQFHETLGGAFSEAWDKAKGAWGKAADFFSGVWDKIKNVFSGVKGFFEEKFSSAATLVKSAWSGVSDFFSGIWDKIKGVFSGAWDTFKEIGGNIVKGLWDGITGLAGWLWDKISGWVSSIWEGVLNFFDINSPSKKFAWVAEMLVKGMGGSIEQNGGQAVQAAQAWSRDLYDAVAITPPELDFGVTTTTPSGSSHSGGAQGGGNTYVTINSPVAVDAVQAAREWRKTAQRLAMSY